MSTNINNQSVIISNNSNTGQIANIVSSSSIMINLPKCFAPGLSIDGLYLPENVYATMSVANNSMFTRNDCIIPFESGVIMTFYVRDYNYFNTFVINDPTNRTKITVSCNNTNNNTVKSINWNTDQLNAVCEFNPISGEGSIVISWLYNRIVIVGTTPFFNKLAY